MDFSTIAVLTIAVFIIFYRIKTWNDVNVLKKDDVIAEEVVEYKVEDSPVKVVKDKKPAKKPVKKTEKKSEAKSKSEVLYKKTLKADSDKNIVLSKALANELGSQLVFEVKSEPKKGVSTLITLVDSYTKDDRAVGLIYESSKSGVTVMKSFDVKMQAKEQFKVATSFSKSLTVKKEDMLAQSIQATKLFVSEDKIFDIKNVAITIK